MNYLSNYTEFILEKNRTYGNCIMIKLDVKNWNDVISVIDENDLYKPEDPTYGVQKNPHVTLLYPVYISNKNKVYNVLDDVLDNSISFEITGIDYFRGAYNEILKFTIKENEYLNRIHNSLRNNIKNGTKFDFNPHITIAYLKPGTAQKYVKDLNFKMENQNNIVFTINKGEIEFKYEWKIDV